MGATRDVAAWVARFSIDDAPPEVIAAAKARVLDTTGVILAGALEPVTRIVGEAVADDGARSVADQTGG